jgi:hypothetical protein
VERREAAATTIPSQKILARTTNQGGFSLLLLLTRKIKHSNQSPHTSCQKEIRNHLDRLPLHSTVYVDGAEGERVKHACMVVVGRPLSTKSFLPPWNRILTSTSHRYSFVFIKKGGSTHNTSEKRVKSSQATSLSSVHMYEYDPSVVVGTGVYM